MIIGRETCANERLNGSTARPRETCVKRPGRPALRVVRREALRRPRLFPRRRGWVAFAVMQGAHQQTGDQVAETIRQLMQRLPPEQVRVAHFCALVASVCSAW